VLSMIGDAILVREISMCSFRAGADASAATRRSGKSRSSYEPGARRETMRLPGATRSGLATRSGAVGPRDEYVVVVSSARSAVRRSLVAPTVITLRELHGLEIVTYPSR